MKKRYTLAFLGASLSLLFVVSCDRDLPINVSYTPYQYASLDPNGGTWSTVLLDAPDQIDIPPPADVNSTEYQSELAELKDAMSGLTSQQREAIDYWTNNPSIRWMEIAMELVAKYNLIPGPNPDGTYTLPSPANPAGPPPFPFAHPAYSCRAFAYMSVAQFDGLIAAWHYKFLYQRPAPSQVDPSIDAAYVDNSLPSYPSGAAVVTIACRDILSAMFPLEKEYLASRAQEHLSSLLWAGEAVQSDIDAGELIGSEVAKLALARAANDGMSKAQVSKAVSDSIKLAAFNRFGWSWENQEIPKRPVGLAPFYGKVKMWNVPNVELTRPGPPPAVGSAELQADIDILVSHQNNMTEEKRRIANYWQDGLGTYTPPGHWNTIAIDYILKYKLNPLRTARTFAYMNMAMQDAGISCWDAKYYYHYPRPIQMIPGFKTIAGTPNFPSYTSGHSTFSAAAAEVLSRIFPQEGDIFREWAEEAAISRVYGGIHWTFDSEVGLEQGKDVGSYTVAVMDSDGAE
ncbi:MAG TPA: phosphatase PAP2 family protein [Cyclobacteriaceae bacterium]